MGWASQHIAKLQQGETVQFRPRGNSMQGKIESGQLVTVDPVNDDTALEVGDVVLCKVGGRQWLHLIRAIRDKEFCIGNNRGHINGWTSRASIYGKCIRVEP
ncbi:MAG TPA: S24/S26 family peptidase [Gemmataceae bacterium]|nr:S24/S26 family peptidase [Gemmataceae bacterium]